MIKTFCGAAALVSTVTVLAQPAFGQVDDSKLGKVHFETSCKPHAQKLFDRAMLYQHSFWSSFQGKASLSWHAIQSAVGFVVTLTQMRCLRSSLTMMRV